MVDTRCFTLAELAERFGGTVLGDSSKLIFGVASIQDAQPEQICFLASANYRKFLADTNAGCVIILAGMADECQSNALVCDNPYLTFAKVSSLFDTKHQFSLGIHP